MSKRTKAASYRAIGPEDGSYSAWQTVSRDHFFCNAVNHSAATGCPNPECWLHRPGCPDPDTRRAP